MKKIGILGVVFSGLFVGFAHAGTMGPVRSAWNGIGTFSAGPVWENAGTQQAFLVTPDIEKAYAPDNSTRTVGDFELFGGGQHALGSKYIGQIGLAVAATTGAKLSGMVWDDGFPEFANYVYQYNVQHMHVAAKAKLLADMGYWVMPWVSGSLGVAFNRAYSYTSTPVIYEAVALPDFESHTSTAFTYTVGAGIQRALNQHWQVGAGYEFADWGKSRLNRSAGQTLNSGLKLNHLYTNGVMFNLTYVS